MLRNRKPSEKELLLELKEKINAIENQLSEPIVINREWMEPKVSQEITIEPTLEIRAIARDIPGHSGESSYFFE